MKSLDKILLVNPPVHDFAAYDLWAKPMGLLVIAKALMERGMAVTLVDALDPHNPFLDLDRLPTRRPHGVGKYHSEIIPKPKALADVRRRYRRYGLSPDMLRKAIESSGSAGAALVTCEMTYWYPGAFEAIGILKEVHPSMPVVLGGTYATLCPDHARRHSGADLVIEGRFEEAAELRDMLKIDKPAAALFDPATGLYPRLDYAPILTSRGCPFRCKYCASKLLFPGYIVRDPGEVLDELDRSYRAGIRDFAFYDDALAFQPEKRLIPILEGIVHGGYEVRLHAPNAMHVSSIDTGLARLMKRAGFVTVRLGVETTASGCERLDNKLDPGELPRVARAFLDGGFGPGEVGAYILAGLPGQKPDSVARDIGTLWEMGLRPYIAEYSPIPGTPLFVEAKAVSRYDIESEPATHNNSALPCASEDFTFDDLQRLKELSWPEEVRQTKGKH